QKTLNWYYSLMDMSEVYRIAMILHPSHKRKYFKRACWSSDWIDQAEQVLRARYEEHY
ncbi:hypothetical protein K435DRAFT_601863, partial [Dendrothele bispora CBS 962.96]